MDTDLPYNLDPLSVVFDVGGYKGDFADMIRKKYGCGVHIFEPTQGFFRDIVERFQSDPMIWPYNVALEDCDKEAIISVRGDSTGFYLDSEVKEVVRVRDIMEFIRNFKFTHIDVLKLNCEGSEYPILVTLNKNKWIQNIRNIIVQFHASKAYIQSEFEEFISDTHIARSKDDHWQWWQLKNL